MDVNSLKALAVPVLTGWVRHGLVALGVYVGAVGVASDANVNAIVTVVTIAAGLAWSAYEKYATKAPVAPTEVPHA